MARTTQTLLSEILFNYLIIQLSPIQFIVKYLILLYYFVASRSIAANNTVGVVRTSAGLRCTVDRAQVNILQA